MIMQLLQIAVLRLETEFKDILRSSFDDFMWRLSLKPEKPKSA
jgi:hypothetical protein